MKRLLLIPLLFLVACGKQDDKLKPLTITCTQTYTACSHPSYTDPQGNCMNDGVTRTFTYSFTNNQGYSPSTCTVSEGGCNPDSPMTSYINSDTKGYVDVVAYSMENCTHD